MLCGLRVLGFKTSGRAWLFLSPGYCDQITNEFTVQAHCSCRHFGVSRKAVVCAHICSRTVPALLTVLIAVK